MVAKKGWSVSLTDGEGHSLCYHKDYPGKGAGLVFDLLSGRYSWEVYLDWVEELDPVVWASGYTGTLREAKKIVDDTFELIGEEDAL